jgi:hypothetical protein
MSAIEYRLAQAANCTFKTIHATDSRMPDVTECWRLHRTNRRAIELSLP